MSTVDMEQLHQDIIQLHQDVTKVRETLALQGQMLMTITQRLDQNTQLSAQQSVQIGSLSTDISVMKSNVSGLVTDMSNLNSWRAETMNIFVPRKEQEAQGHERRIAALEEALREASATKSDNQFNFLKWLVDHGITILLFIANIILTLYNSYHH